MSSWFSSSSSSSKKKKGEKKEKVKKKKRNEHDDGGVDLAALGLDPSLLADPVAGLDVDADEHVDLAQINDPSFGKRRPRARQNPAAGGGGGGSQVDLNAAMSLANEDPTLQVEFREEDMRDPALLADLASLNAGPAPSGGSNDLSSDRVRLVRLDAQLKEHKDSCLFFKVCVVRCRISGFTSSLCELFRGLFVCLFVNLSV
jgi:hypothetical protein